MKKGPTHVMAYLLINPCRPRVRNPPRNRIISRSPRRCARRSFVFPQSLDAISACVRKGGGQGVARKYQVHTTQLQ